MHGIAALHAWKTPALISPCTSQHAAAAVGRVKEVSVAKVNVITSYRFMLGRPRLRFIASTVVTSDAIIQSHVCGGCGRECACFNHSDRCVMLSAALPAVYKLQVKFNH